MLRLLENSMVIRFGSLAENDQMYKFAYSNGSDFLKKYKKIKNRKKNYKRIIG